MSHRISGIMIRSSDNPLSRYDWAGCWVPPLLLEGEGLSRAWNCTEMTSIDSDFKMFQMDLPFCTQSNATGVFFFHYSLSNSMSQNVPRFVIILVRYIKGFGYFFKMSTDLHLP